MRTLLICDREDGNHDNKLSWTLKKLGDEGGVRFAVGGVSGAWMEARGLGKRGGSGVTTLGG
jgi:hypothetical protein